MAIKQPKKSNRRKWVRYENNSLWHTDYKQLDNDLCYLDDVSRFVTGYGIFSNATGSNAIMVLEKAIKKYDKPASIMTDYGT